MSLRPKLGFALNSNEITYVKNEKSFNMLYNISADRERNSISIPKRTQ